MTTEAWLAVAAVAVLVLIALLIGLLLYRRRKVSFGTTDTTAVTDTTTDTKAVEGRGGYQAGGGFTFSTGTEAAATPQPRARMPEPAPIERVDVDGQPGVGDDASIPRDAPRQTISDVSLPDVVPNPVTDEAAGTPAGASDSSTSADAPAGDATPAEPTPTGTPAPESVPPVAAESVPPVATEVVPAPAGADVEPVAAAETIPATPAEITPPAAETAPAAPAPVLDTIEPTAGRLVRLRGRLARSQNAMGRSLLGLLGGGDLDEDAWEEVEDTLIMADLGPATTAEIVERLRSEMAIRGVRNEEQARAVLREVLVDTLDPGMDRSIRALPHDGRPSVLLVVGVNGTGKTTTTGKLARVLVADGRRVVLGAADTFRAAAADQLQTWAQRVGAEVVRGKEGADPASVAFDAVVHGIDNGADAVLIDTAGRLHTKTGLMDELGKVKRVVEKKALVDDVILVLDATIGQNGLTQARVFADVVDITGVALTKLDGTAKGGIVFQVQRELKVPVKLVGLGEGADDLAPFEPGAFVDALLG
ncbi:signal recognition particle-docking protein FtsY [Millisia brevis]|uniref:signal recognition particle-docking protein FtsY n=1 Tax=Millisia brevis TaxID=264148 RepID=UPI00082A8DF8|nr:signal recognition particle-docking protein FtsY [Millisia brevis]